MSSPFDSIKVFVQPNGTRVVSWQFTHGVQIPQTATITVQRARAGGQWQTLEEGLPVSYCYSDTTAWNRNKYQNDYYRLILQTQDGQSYTSDPQHTGMTLSYPYYSQAANLIRLSQLQIQRTGRQGYLLKKITYGPKCPVCQQFGDDHPVNQHCPQCLGTGKKGGYYKAIPLGVLQQGQSADQSVAMSGQQVSQTLTVKCTAWPIIQYGDVWADKYTSLRYYIDKIQVASKFKHVPLIYTLQMHLIQQSDIMYTENANQLLQEAHVQYSNPDWDKTFGQL